MHDANTAKFTLAELQHLLPNDLPYDPLSPFSTGPTPISDEIMQLNYLISHLQARRALLLQHWNTQHSPIFILPSELLAVIFLYVDVLDRPGGCHLLGRRRRHPLAPIRLGAVSSHWRQVAWNTPQLWSQLTLSGCWAWEAKFPLTSVLSTYFQNVKAMTLDLFIDCFLGQFQALVDSERLEDRVPYEEAFNIIFVENAHKLRTLGFKMWPAEWLQRIEKVQEGTTFSHLEELWIKSQGADDEDKLSFINAPSLRKVEFKGFVGSPEILLPWAQIAHLELSDVPSDLCLKLLFHCTNLEYFHCEELSPPDSETHIVRDQVTFPHLVTFHYIDRELSPAWREAMGRYFQFPALESVIWNPDWSGGVERQLLRKFPISIRDLEFQFRRRDQPRLKPMLIPLKSLEQLKVTCWPLIKLTLLELLTPQLNKKFPLLPSLTKLHFSAKSNDMTTRIVESLLTMIRSRRMLTKLDHLVLSYDVRSTKLSPWPEEFVEGIQELVRDGMRIVIEADNEEVDHDWLRCNTTGSNSSSSPDTSNIGALSLSVETQVINEDS